MSAFPFSGSHTTAFEFHWTPHVALAHQQKQPWKLMKRKSLKKKKKFKSISECKEEVIDSETIIYQF